MGQRKIVAGQMPIIINSPFYGAVFFFSCKITFLNNRYPPERLFLRNNAAAASDRTRNISLQFPNTAPSVKEMPIRTQIRLRLLDFTAARFSAALQNKRKTIRALPYARALSFLPWPFLHQGIFLKIAPLRPKRKNKRTARQEI